MSSVGAAEPKQRFAAEELRAFATGMFAHAGLAGEHAAIVADALVYANLRGLDTHGLVRIPAYLKRIAAGLINTRPEIRRHSPMPFSSVFDADNAMGPVGARLAMDACVETADRLGIGVATVRRSNHFGAASVYTVPPTAKGLITVVMSPAARSLAAHGSRAPLLGTNPFAVATPAGKYGAWSLDMAASVAARGHIRLAAQEGRAIPEGWALDPDGAPTTDAQAALRGTMLPFSGAKGSALAMMVDILGGVLSGSAFAGDTRDWNTDFTGPADVGHFLLAMKVEAFMPLAEFESRMETAIGRLKALPPAQGFDEVRFPGERSGNTEIERRRHGIPLSVEAVTSLRAQAASSGVEFPAPLA
ncbi:Ldh family oxidoreductase [Arvimicrobium flavum]|uniref:Ldh family oxidoreductase n=1 Tax=Arvimicrobium flavum TaxID=3393320 RepID=UPI00237BEA62|nr:Ldh family oxidoreductase [Mesorhizobium shangrilense]